MSQSIDTATRYLSFTLGQESYAIPLLSVREVLALPEITPVPHAPPHFLGIMNLRGNVISVVDLRQKLGIKPGKSAETSVIICDLGALTLGVVVDSIQSVLAPQPNEVSESPETLGGKGSEYISGVYRKDKDLVLVLDIARTLSVEERRAAQAQAQPRATA